MGQFKIIEKEVSDVKGKIHIDQLGYITHMPKKAVCVGTGSSFEIVDIHSDKIMYAGVLPPFKFDEASGENVSAADFSSFNLPGEYCIKIGRKRSDTFTISDKPYTKFKNTVLKALYLNRCGATDSDYAGDYAHEKCHSAEAMLFENNDIKLDVSGGWHDSGSYGKYTVTACTALGHMLYAYKLFPEAFKEKNNIPQGLKDMPDILCECRTELEWLLKMQDRDGGVYHKVCTLKPSGLVLPDEDKEQMYIFPCSHQATANFIAVAALASGIYSEFDSDFADLLESAAFNGWIWLSNRPEYKPFFNPPAVKYSTVGDYSDENFGDDLFWAACELYSMTGEDIFRKKIFELYRSVGVTGFVPANVGGFGALAYILCSRPKDVEVERSIRLQYRIEADNLTSISEKSGYGTALKYDEYGMGSNITVLTKAMVLIYAYILLKCENYRNIAEEQLDYILGKNPMGVCYVTGMGAVPVQNPHHRQSAFDEVDQPVPGMVMTGPNSNRSDDYARWNIPNNTPPAKCYCDAGFCYSTNEAAINANSAALFVTAFFEALED